VKRISAEESKRMSHINFVMNGLHNHVSAIYEHLADREIREAKAQIHALNKSLKSLLTSMEDEI